MATRVKRIMTMPISLVFRFLQSKTRVQIWLYEMSDMRMEGVIIVSSPSDPPTRHHRSNVASSRLHSGETSPQSF